MFSADAKDNSIRWIQISDNIVHGMVCLSYEFFLIVLFLSLTQIKHHAPPLPTIWRRGKAGCVSCRVKENVSLCWPTFGPNDGNTQAGDAGESENNYIYL